MTLIITTENLEPVQTAQLRVLTLEGGIQRPVKVIVVPMPDTNVTRVAHRAVDVPDAPEDDLALATWEDAEWR